MSHTYTSFEKNIAICKKELDLIPNGNFLSNGYEQCHNMQFFHVCGITNFWESEKKININNSIADILSGCVKHGIPFSYVIIGDENGINIFVGTVKLLLNKLRDSYEAFFPGISIIEQNNNPLNYCKCSYGGLFNGIPTNKNSSEERVFQIENICRGMLGKNFVYVILASGMSNIAVTFGHEKILVEMEETYAYINQTFSGGAQGNISAQRQDFQSKNYFENLEIMEKYLQSAMMRGMWRFNGYYASDSPINAMSLGNLIKSSFAGENSKPEPFRIIEYNSIKDVITNTYMMADLITNSSSHPLGQWHRDGIAKDISLYIYKFQTLLTSDQLAILCQLPLKEFPGYYIDDYVEFDISNRIKNQLKEPIEIGKICVSGRNANYYENNSYYLEKNDFTRHALIIGITGGGKTNTSKSLLNTLWNVEHCPFLVIESAKREYWELRNLKGFENLLVFTLGSESSQTSVKYRINPFETNKNISLQTHIDYLLSTFKAAFELYPPMPYILEKAVYEIYSDRGWDIVENTNVYGFSKYPTLSDLYNKIDVIVDRLGYHQEIQSNVKAALQARISSLMIGGKGAMLNTPTSFPISDLLSRPVVMELEDLGDDETKSFVIGILLVQLYEYRKSLMTQGAKQLSHILMVEEAHRLLKNVTENGEGGNTRAKSVEFFCNLLAEIRTFGQGIIVADQIPTKIASDTIKNTNLKIVHRTVAAEDREVMGKAMNMTEAQINYLSSLQRGYAAVYAEGDNKPKCVKFPLIENYYNNERSKVIDESRKNIKTLAEYYTNVVHIHAACSYCEEQCIHLAKIKNHLEKNIDIEKVLSKLKSWKFQPDIIDLFVESKLLSGLDVTNIFVACCIIGYVLDYDDLNDGERQKIIANYLKYKLGYGGK